MFLIYKSFILKKMKAFTIFLFFSILALATPESNEENILPTFNLKICFYNGDFIKLEISNKDP